MLGGAALGYASRQGWLQKIPVLGKAGPITSASLLGWGAEEILHVKLPKLVHDAVTAGLVVSSFYFGASGGEALTGENYPGGAVFYDE
jgi:hypothetical protein